MSSSLLKASTIRCSVHLTADSWTYHYSIRYFITKFKNTGPTWRNLKNTWHRCTWNWNGTKKGTVRRWGFFFSFLRNYELRDYNCCGCQEILLLEVTQPSKSFIAWGKLFHGWENDGALLIFLGSLAQAFRLRWWLWWPSRQHWAQKSPRTVGRVFLWEELVEDGELFVTVTRAFLHFQPFLHIWPSNEISD